jgi:hypothetical protein
MIRFISHFIKIIIGFILSLLFSSCQHKIELGDAFSSIEGSETIISEKRNLSDFDKIDVSQAINVELTQGKTFFVEVETNDNIMPYLSTEVSGGTLKIYYNKKFNSFRNTDTKIKITMPELEKISASSASSVVSKSNFSGNKIQMKTSSASTVEMTLEYDVVNVDASSASNLTLKGLALENYFESSSASVIDAQALKANMVEAEASSGSNIYVFPIKQLTAKASSGSVVTLKNKAESETVKTSSGGSIDRSY